MNNHYTVVHLKLRKYKCSWCSYSAGDKNTLKQHNVNKHHKVDTETKSVACDSCDKRFLYQIQLDEHIAVVHKGERPHCCHKCGKTFGFKFRLHNHIKVCINLLFLVLISAAGPVNITLGFHNT